MRAHLSRERRRAGKARPGAPAAARGTAHAFRGRRRAGRSGPAHRGAGRRHGRSCPRTARGLARAEGALLRRRAGGEGAGSGDPHEAHPYDALRLDAAQGGAPPLRGRRRDPALAAEGERPRRVPLHGGRVPLPARGRGPVAHVRGRGRRLQDE